MAMRGARCAGHAAAVTNQDVLTVTVKTEDATPAAIAGEAHREGAEARHRPGPLRACHGAMHPKISPSNRQDRASRRTSMPANWHPKYGGS